MKDHRLFEHANKSIAFMGQITGLPVKLFTEAEYDKIVQQVEQLTIEDQEGR